MSKITAYWLHDCPALLAQSLENVRVAAEIDARFKPLRDEYNATISKQKRKSIERGRFLRSSEWKAARADVFKRDGKVCAKCGSADGLQIDHIKPRSRHPELALSLTNLRVLCWPCNKAKGVKAEA